MENLSNSLSLFNPGLPHGPPPPDRAANLFHLLAHQESSNGEDDRYNSYTSYGCGYGYEDMEIAQTGAHFINTHHRPNPPPPSTPFSFFHPHPLNAQPSLPLFEAATVDMNGHPNLSLLVANHDSANPHEDMGVADHSTTPKRTSIYRGVTKHRWTGRFEAHLWDNSCTREGSKRKGRQVYLGGYEKEEDAAHSYDLAALKFWGPTATINYPLSHYEKELVEMRHMTRHEYVSSLRRKSSGFSRGASKYRGVTRHHQHGRWQARIGRVAGNKDLYLGTFATQEEAAEAYDMAAVKFRGMNAVTNFDINRYNVSTILEGNRIPPPCQSRSGSRSKSTSEEQETSESGNAMSNPDSLVGATSRIYGAKEATTSNNSDSMNINQAIEWNFLSLVHDDNSGSDVVEMGGAASGLAKMGEASFRLLDKLDMSNNTFPFDNNARAHLGVLPQGIVNPQYFPAMIGKDQDLRAHYFMPYMTSKDQDLMGAHLACS